MEDDGDEFLREREVVIEDFMEAHPLPMKNDIEDWQARHPRHSSQILEAAYALHRWGNPVPPSPPEAELEASWQRHLSSVERIRDGEEVDGKRHASRRLPRRDR